MNESLQHTDVRPRQAPSAMHPRAAPVGDRQYVERNHWLLEHHFDPRSDLALNDSGPWSWRSDKTALQEQIEQYFSTRREDESAAM